MGRSILVVDPDPSFTKALSREKGGLAASLEITPLAAPSARAAIDHVADPSRAIVAVFIESALQPREWIPVLESVNARRPHSPVFLMIDRIEPPVTEPELRSLGVAGFARKPIGFSQMVKLVSPLSISREVDAKLRALRSAGLPPCPVGADRDAEFLPVAAEALLARAPVRTDLYLRLASGRYFKVLHSGDFLDSDRFDTYVSGGVTHFHLRRADHERILREFSRLTGKLISDPSAPAPVKIAATLRFGEEVLAFLDRAGIDARTVVTAKDYVSRAYELVRALDFRRRPAMESLVAEIPNRAHEAATALVAQVFASFVGVEAREAIETVGVAALLHDIALLDAPESIAGEDPSLMTLEEGRLFRMHPDQGAAMLAEIPGIAPAAVEAIARHHLRRNGLGFPPRTPGDNASPVGELVGVADELVRLVTASARSGGRIDPVSRMVAGPLKGFSPWVAKAFRDLFVRTG